ncbi:MAG TPA: urease accessory UreF family protein [Propionibacteriaceae bacterium]
MTAAYLTLLLADSRLPTGAHTQSAGLEPAFAHGMRLDQVPDYLRVRLTTVTEVEAACAVVARHLWLTAPSRAEAMVTVDAAWRVRTLSDALREASDLLGRSYLRMAGAVWGLAELGGASGQVWCRAVVIGATAAEAGISAADTARLIGFEDVQTVIAAALKLLPFDPSQGVRWSAEAAEEVEQMVVRVSGCRSTAEIPAHSAPLIEEWGQRHRTTQRRLFRA